MIPPLKFLPKPTQQQPENGSRYPRRFLVENTMTTLWFWGFWGSLAPHFIGKCIIPGSLAPQYYRVDESRVPSVLFVDVLLHDNLEDSPGPKKLWKNFTPKNQGQSSKKMSPVSGLIIHFLYLLESIFCRSELRYWRYWSHHLVAVNDSHATVVYIKRVDETQPSKGLEIPKRK